MQLLYGELTGEIIGAALTVYRKLGGGFFESVYAAALLHELRKKGLQFEREYPIKVQYEGVLLRGFRADILVEGKVILELKAASCIVKAHVLQARNHLAASGFRLALVMNFGSSKLEWKRVIL